jgi:hypothetical protein
MDRKKLLFFIIQMTPIFLRKSRNNSTENVEKKDLAEKLNKEPKIITWKNVAKFVVCVSSFTGFFYQASEYFVQYLSFPTTVDVRIERSLMIDIPSVTICIPSLTSRPRLRKIYGDEIIKEIEKIKGKANKPYAVLEREVYRAYENISARKVSPQEFFNLGIHAAEIINCTVLKPKYFNNLNETWIPCTLVSDVLETIGPNGKCFTYFTKLNQNKTKDFKERFRIDIYQSVRDEVGLAINIILTFNSSNYIDVAKLGDESITLHETTAVPTEGKRRRLKPGTNYDIFFTKILTINLPPPYTTGCEQYQVFNPSVPQSRVDCVDRCIKEIYYNSCSCYPLHVVVRHDIVINHNLSMCNNSDSRINHCKQKEVSSRCIEKCKLDCEEVAYDFDTEEDVYPTESELHEADPEEKEKLRRFQNFTAQIRLWRKVSGDTIYEHKAELPLIQLFSFVGGLASLWLGISIIAFYDILVKVVTIIYKTKPFEKMRKRDTAVSVLSSWGTNATKAKSDMSTKARLTKLPSNGSATQALGTALSSNSRQAFI